MGADAFMKLSGLVPPQFNKISQDDFYSKSIVKFDTLLDQYKTTIESAKISN